VPRSAQELYEALRELAREKAQKQGVDVTDVAVTQREIREATEGSPFLIKVGLRILAELEYVILSGSRTRGARNAYFLIADEPLHLVDFSPVPEPETLRQRARKRGWPVTCACASKKWVQWVMSGCTHFYSRFIENFTLFSSGCYFSGRGRPKKRGKRAWGHAP